MANEPISGLPAASALTGVDLTAAVQGGITKKATMAQIATYVGSVIPADTNIYNTNGSLTANRALSLNGFNLTLGAPTTCQLILQTSGVGFLTTNNILVLDSPTIHLSSSTHNLSIDTTTTNFTAPAFVGGGLQYLTVDNSGTLTPVGIPVDTNIYNSDGTLTATRTLALGTHTLILGTGLSGSPTIIMNPVSNNLVVKSTAGTITVGDPTQTAIDVEAVNILNTATNTISLNAPNVLLNALAGGGTRSLAVDNTGKIIIGPADVNIYNSDGSLTGNRVLSLNGHDLQLGAGATSLLSLNTAGTPSLTGNSTLTLDAPTVHLSSGTHTLDIDNSTINFTHTPFTGSGQQYLTVTNTGLLTPVSPSASQNIYNTDGTITADRTVLLGGHTLQFGAGGIFGTVIFIDEVTPTIGIKCDGGSLDLGNITQTSIGLTAVDITATGTTSITIDAPNTHLNSGANELDIDTDNVVFTQPPFTGGGTQFLSVDNTGKLGVSAGASVNIYNTNGSLTSNRTLTTGGFSFSISGQDAITIGDTNTISSVLRDNLVAGGFNNVIIDGTANTIIGSYGSTLRAGLTIQDQRIILGGQTLNMFEALNAFLVGGQQNTLGSNTPSSNSGYLGGMLNTIDGDYTVGLGGLSNIISGQYSAMIAGQNNQVMGDRSWVGAGSSNNVDSGCNRCAVLNGTTNHIVGATNSIAAGQQVSLSANNAFMWNASGSTFSGTTAGSFTINPTSGMGINIGDPLSGLDINTGIGLKLATFTTSTSTSSLGTAVILQSNFTGVGTVTLTLSTTDKVARRTYIIKDIAGTAAAKNIIVTPQTGLIDGLSSLSITVNGGMLGIYCDGTNWHSFIPPYLGQSQIINPKIVGGDLNTAVNVNNGLVNCLTLGGTGLGVNTGAVNTIILGGDNLNSGGHNCLCGPGNIMSANGVNNIVIGGNNCNTDATGGTWASSVQNSGLFCSQGSAVTGTSNNCTIFGGVNNLISGASGSSGIFSGQSNSIVASTASMILGSNATINTKTNSIIINDGGNAVNAVASNAVCIFGSSGIGFNNANPHSGVSLFDTVEFKQVTTTVNATTSGLRSYYIGVATQLGAVTITLSTSDNVPGRTYIIYNSDGFATLTNDVIISPQSGLINGVGSTNIVTAYGMKRIWGDGTNWFAA